jgi:hypothetical protein
MLIIIAVLLFAGGAIFKTDSIFGMSILLLGLAFFAASFLWDPRPWRKG